jgi:hypothetical protein
VYECLIQEGNWVERAKTLEDIASYPLPKSLQDEYESLDKLRIEAIKLAEKKCRKLCMGQVSFSPTIQHAM